MKWYFGPLKKYATFKGRARRKEYWLFVLWNGLASLAIAFVTGIIGAIVALAQFAGGGNHAGIIGVANGCLACIFYSLAVGIPTMAVAIRRMHDTGRSGWWLFLPVIGFVLLFVDGQPGENRYGSNPKTADLSRTAARAA
jgi:uncharacterized membrane protein YhaH (DUF805 family)